jgi:hypothetical protein
MCFQILSTGDHKNPPKQNKCKKNSELKMRSEQKNFQKKKYKNMGKLVLTCFNFIQEAGWELANTILRMVFNVLPGEMPIFC